MNSIRRIISIFLSILVLTAGAPVSVFAQENTPPLINSEELAHLIESGSFGRSDMYAKYARIQARQAKAGESIVTVLADGTRETKNVAKAGDWIVTNPGGEQYIVNAENFAKKYEAAMDLGNGWFKPKGKPQKFVKINQDLSIMASWGEKQFLRSGDYLNITNPSDIYGVAAKEFNDTYKSIRVLYEESLKGIQSFFLKVEGKLSQRLPNYSGVFFRKVLANDTNFMIKKLEAQAAKKAEANAAKATGKKIALRVLGATLFGSALYFGITLATAPEIEKGKVTAVTPKSQVIKNTIAKVEGLNEEQKNMITDLSLFMDPNARPLILRDPALLEKMGTYSAVIQSAEFDAENAAEFIADQLVSIEVQEKYNQALQS